MLFPDASFGVVLLEWLTTQTGDNEDVGVFSGPIDGVDQDGMVEPVFLELQLAFGICLPAVGRKIVDEAGQHVTGRQRRRSLLRG